MKTKLEGTKGYCIAWSCLSEGRKKNTFISKYFSFVSHDNKILLSKDVPTGGKGGEWKREM